MKNKFTLVFVFTFLIASVLGCSSISEMTKDNSSSSNKSLTDKAVDTAVGESKIGVPECDEVIDLLTAEANNPDDNFVTKAVKATVLNKIKDAIKQSVEENKTDKAAMAKDCKQFKVEFDKYKAEGRGEKGSVVLGVVEY